MALSAAPFARAAIAPCRPAAVCPEQLKGLLAYGPKCDGTTEIFASFVSFVFLLPIVFWRSFPPTAVVDIQPAGPTDEPQTRNSGLLPRTLAEMVLAARGGHMNSGLLSRALAELILAAVHEARRHERTTAESTYRYTYIYR